MRTAYLNERGATSLVEILVALVLMTVVFTGLLTSSILVANQNMETLLRDEATAIAEQRMNEARDMPFDTLTLPATSDPALPAGFSVTRAFRGLTGFTFHRCMTVTPLNSNNNQVVVQVQWTQKSILHTHAITGLVRRPGS